MRRSLRLLRRCPGLNLATATETLPQPRPAVFAAPSLHSCSQASWPAVRISQPPDRLPDDHIPAPLGDVEQAGASESDSEPFDGPGNLSPGSPPSSLQPPALADSHMITFQAQNKEWVVETGRLARLANGSVTIQAGGTTVLATIMSLSRFSQRKDASLGALPFRVDYREKLYAVGKIPGTYNKREAAPKEHEMLAARRVERALRSVLPRGYVYDTDVTAAVLSADGREDPQVLALNAASAAMAVSDIPWMGPIGAARVNVSKGGTITVGCLIPEKELSEKQTANDLSPDLSLLIAVTEDKVVLVEAETHVPVAEDVFIEAMRVGEKAARELLEPQRRLAEMVKRGKRSVALAGADPAAARRLDAAARDAAARVLRASDLGAAARAAALADAKSKLEDEMRRAGAWRADSARVIGSGCVSSSDLDHAFSAAVGKELRELVLSEGLRPDGRGVVDLRPSHVGMDHVPVVHGSAVFDLGETQALCTATVGTKAEQQRMESLLGGEGTKRLFVHYTLPDFALPGGPPERGASASGSGGGFGGSPVGGIVRHEMDRSAFIERALTPVLPHEQDSPFTFRLNVEALGADGGSTAAAVCGASLSLADAGVALRSLVAAVSVGLISEGGTWDGESRRSSSLVPLPSSAAMPPSKTDAACTESGIPLGFLTQSTSGSDLGQYELLTDPCGIEAALGDMELRVAGTADGITAAQLDVRVPGGIPMEALEAAFKRACVARLRLLTVMQSALPQERCARAPVFDVVQVPPSCIGAVLGKEGSNLRSIEAATGCRINVENDGALCVYAPSRSHFEKARLSLRSVTGESMQKGEVYRGKIVALKDFGAWVAFPGSAAHALLHISEVAMTRIRAVEDVLAAGQSVEVVFMGRDNRGTLRVSRKAALKLQQEDEKREQKGVAQDGKRHGDENEQPLRTA